MIKLRFISKGCKCYCLWIRHEPSLFFLMKHNRTTMGLVRAVIICAVFGWTTHGSGSSADISLVKAVGDTALFNTSRDPAPYTDLSWKFRGILPIITVNAGVDSTWPSYVDRITLFDDGSLELRNLTLNDRGNYTVSITSTRGLEFNGVFFLYVFEPVSGVSLLVSANASDLIEYTALTLTCLASGSSRFSFYNRSHTMEEEYPPLADLNLIVSRYDTGPFRCEAYNLINRVRSEGINFTISYGPDVEMKAVPFEDRYAEGSNVTLVCTVRSKPEAEITWYFGNELLPFYGTELVLEDLTWKMSGYYRCLAYNRKTNRYRSSLKYISVKHKKYHNDGLSVGTLLRIASACTVVGVFAGGLAFLYHRKQKRGAPYTLANSGFFQ